MRKFLVFVLLGTALEFGAVAGILYVAFSYPEAVESEVYEPAAKPPLREDRYREWYLRSLWDIHQQMPDSPVLTALYERSDHLLRNYILPRTSEDFLSSKTTDTYISRPRTHRH